MRERVIYHLVHADAAPGNAFFSDAELVERSGLSRSTVRRALDALHREGWVSREAGRGTFAGPRLAQIGQMVQPPRSAAPGRALRLGVVIFDVAGLAEDWITPHVLAGIDEAAEEAGVTIEIVGSRSDDADVILRRLDRDRPDVLASLAAKPRDALLLRDAIRLGIPSLVMGTAHQYLGLPAVVEDNAAAARAAVGMLAEAGHERVGLLLNRWPAGWVFERQEGFERAMLDAGLDVDVPGTCWLGAADHPGVRERRVSHRDSALTRRAADEGQPGAFEPLSNAVERATAWLDRHRPTAVVAGSYIPAWAVGEASRSLGLSIPRDLSVVAFDPHPDLATWLGSARPTLVRLPLRAIGRTIARVSRSLAEGADPEAVGRVLVPFETEPGQTLAPPATRT